MKKKHIMINIILFTMICYACPGFSEDSYQTILTNSYYETFRVYELSDDQFHDQVLADGWIYGVDALRKHFGKLYPNIQDADLNNLFILSEKMIYPDSDKRYEVFYTDDTSVEYYYRYDIIHRDLSNVEVSVYVSQDGKHLYGTDYNLAEMFAAINAVQVSYKEAIRIAKETYKQLYTNHLLQAEDFEKSYGSEYTQIDSLIPEIDAFLLEETEPYWIVRFLQPMHRQSHEYNEYSNIWMTLYISARSGEVLNLSDDLFSVYNSLSDEYKPKVTD